MMYAPPNASADYHKDLTNYLAIITALPNPIFILGDFNLSDINWLTLTGTTSISNEFCKCVIDSNLTQLV